MKKLVIIDGNSIINRAFYGIRLLSNSKGVYTNAVYGFLNIFLKLLEEVNPEYAAVAFDLSGPTFRHEKYDLYKAQRKGMPEELAVQMPVLKEILKVMDIKILEKEGYEADDIIGTISKLCEEKQVLCVILSGDKDDLQLVSDTTLVKLVITKMGNTETSDYDVAKVRERFEIDPQRFVDVKALMGDASDNVPGVKGIGEKTAFSLIKQFQTLENLYENLHEADLTKSVKTKLEEGKDMAFLSRELCTIYKEVPIECGLADMKKGEPNQEKLLELFTELEFKSFIARMGLVKHINEQKTDVVDITNVSQIEKGDTLYYILDKQKDDIKALTFTFGGDTLLRAKFDTKLEQLEFYRAFSSVFEDENIKKIGHNIKEDAVLLKKLYGIQIKNIAFDTMIACYLDDPSRSGYDLFGMQEIYLGGAQVKKGCEAVLLPKLKDKLETILKEKQLSDLFYQIEMPLSGVLTQMEISGVAVDKQSLEAFSKKLSGKLDILTKSIYEKAGEEFNINSPKQLGVILFEKLGLPAVKKTKTGYSTDVSVLEKLAGDHEIIADIISYRTHMKLKTTYADGLVQVINPNTNRIHSSFNQTVTTTGRISSTEPNLQNIPVRLELGREIRKMFIAGSDSVLLGADYSQIELRVLAHMADDSNMIDAFLQKKDIHTITASRIFKVVEKEVTSEMRGRAKTVNFGIVYGMGDFSLATDLHITRKMAREYIDSYFAEYPGIKAFLDAQIEQAKKDGYVKTLFGRRRYINELKSSNFNLRSFGERVAMNTPIQGSAADIIKIAMVKVHDRLLKENLKSRLILQVHDELIVEVKKGELEQAKVILKEQMESAAELKVPLLVDMNSGGSWYETK